MSDQGAGSSIRCFITTPFPCSYLEDREAQNLIVDPSLPPSTDLLGNMLNLGFRRSGRHLYRPECPNCQSCVSLRIGTQRFVPNRSQRRNLKDNREITHHVTPAKFNKEHYQLYIRYIDSRHPDSSMANPTEAEYMEFLESPGIDTRFHEFRLNGKLVAVAVTDHTQWGLSAVYTFFDPNLGNRGLGTYAILKQIDYAKRLRLPWIYLGYWIEECPKMNYKNKFKPCQGYIDGHWQDL